MRRACALTTCSPECPPINSHESCSRTSMKTEFHWAKVSWARGREILTGPKSRGAQVPLSSRLAVVAIGLLGATGEVAFDDIEIRGHMNP